MFRTSLKQVQLAASSCCLPLVPKSNLSGVLRRHALRAWAQGMHSFCCLRSILFTHSPPWETSGRGLTRQPPQMGQPTWLVKKRGCSFQLVRNTYSPPLIRLTNDSAERLYSHQESKPSRLLCFHSHSLFCITFFYY